MTRPALKWQEISPPPPGFVGGFASMVDDRCLLVGLDWIGRWRWMVAEKTDWIRASFIQLGLFGAVADSVEEAILTAESEALAKALP